MTTSLRRLAFLVVLAALLVAAALPASSNAALTKPSRTWVSGVGDDVNPCSRTAPCKTFAGAFARTASLGEIDALDPGGFGQVTINRSMTIDGAGTLASILNAGVGAGIIINGNDIDVVLRNLTIHGGSLDDLDPALPTTCGTNAANGIRIINARSVRLENITIDRQESRGISIEPAAGTDISVSTDNVSVSNVCGSGIRAASTTTGKATLLMRETSVARSTTAVEIGANVTATLAESTLFGNARGVSVIDGGTLDNHLGNVFVANPILGDFTTTVGVASPVTVTPTPVTVQVQSIIEKTPTPLVVAIADTSLAARSGARVGLVYAATTPATVELQVRRGRATTVATVTGRARKGSNTIVWNGRIDGKPAPAGTYTLRLALDGAGDATAVANATLRVSAPR